MKSQNHLYKSLFFVLLVFLITGFLSFISEKDLEICHLKKMDIFSDIRKHPDPQPDCSSISVIDKAYITQIDSCKDGITCFEDYSPDKTGLNRFLNVLGNDTSTVRIAFFGDSFIEGDIFSGDLRELLQDKFGGKGAGMLPVSSTLNYWRKTVIHEFSNTWNVSSSFQHKKGQELGIFGNVFIPENKSWVYYSGAKRKQESDTCQRVSIFYQMNRGNGSISYQINHKTENKLDLHASNNVERADIFCDTISSIRLRFPGNPYLQIYGISMENRMGVVLDNYSMRSVSGYHLKNFSQPLLMQIDSLCHYDLIILEYGLNIVNNKQKDYSIYQKEMTKTIQYLRTCFSHADILLLSIADRSMRKEGSYETAHYIPLMVEAQRKICIDNGIVFWNLFEAMGGKNSMVGFVNAKPAKANKDYTHLTFEGGKYIGNLLFETIVYEKERYEKKIYLETFNQ